MNEPSNPRDSESYLTLLARRLAADMTFMAGVLAVYQRNEHLGDDALADKLKISRSMLTRLALCKRPQSGKSTFADQIRQIASYTGVDAVTLANIIHQAESLESLKEIATQRSDQQSLSANEQRRLAGLAAARDHPDDEAQHSNDDEEYDE